MSLEPLWDDLGIPLALMGILVVFAALVLVSTFISLLPRLMGAWEGLAPNAKLPHAAATTESDEPSEETVAVIVAAVAAVVGDPHRIVRIETGLPTEAHWALEGRRQHHASHLPNWKGSRP